MGTSTCKLCSRATLAWCGMLNGNVVDTVWNNTRVLLSKSQVISMLNPCHTFIEQVTVHHGSPRFD